MRAYLVVEAAQDIFAAINQRHMRTQTGKNPGKLNRDIAAALNDDAPREFGKVKRLVGRDGVLESRNWVAVARRAAGGDQDIGRANALAVRQLHGVRIGQHGAGLEDLYAGLLQKRAVNGLKPPDFLILVGDQRRPIEGRVRYRPAEAGSVLEFIVETRGIDQKLFRYAAADDAGAAEAVFLGERDARAVLRGNAGRAHAARTAANDEKVKVEIGHIRCHARAFSSRSASSP